MLDLAIGVIIGGAFGEIVNSLVNDMLMPIIGLLLGGIDFSSLQITINDATIRYGAFIQSVVDFLIITFSIFIFIRAINRLKKKQEEKPAAPLEPTKEEILLTEIRDILKDKR
ncbi:large conductance mechanosensitive channel [Lutispora thermophila DSM 19022]|uniref:Large conductance mechanosensitive channel n=1 Tax=Lutispora thermophila DSM 19022 TaxID=1122184 RepID=A0A1M6CCN1_9FIRM|nr:large conductance mechanosensitive channel [Lutispora thermophila DSM 19022]